MHIIKYVLLLFLAFHCVKASAQTRTNPYTKQILQQANLMGRALLKKDYNVFLSYMHPAVLKVIGSKEKFIKLMTEGSAQMKKEGTGFRKIGFGQPMGIVDTANTLQCVLPEQVHMTTPTGDIINHTSLLALSKDKGKTWLFIELLDQDKLVQIRGFLPVISSKIRVPDSFMEQVQ